MARILLLDDDPLIRRAIELHLRKQGHDVVSGKDGSEGLDLITRERFDLVVTDLKMPGATGLELLDAIRDRQITTPVIVLTAFGSIETAVAAMKRGASDFISKPPQLDEITIKVNNLLARQELVEENRRLKRELEGRFGFQSVVGNSPALCAVLEKVELLARDPDISILLAGESGTGKELVARAIHYNSPRASARFVAINCGALPEDLIESELFGHVKGAFTGAVSQKKGLFEVAHRGTLFLDEISAMPVKTQVKLLRALEEREIRQLGGTTQIPVDLRIISASNQNLDEMVEERSFREDLYYRLAGAHVSLPSLRERTGDMPLLVNHFLQRFNREKNKTVTLDPEAMKLLETYHWPGNVRELAHLLELLVVTSPSNTISVQDLPQKIRSAGADAIRMSLEDPDDDFKAAGNRIIAVFEREFIRRQLEKHHWNISRTADAIGLSRSTLHAKMKEHGIGA